MHFKVAVRNFHACNQMKESSILWGFSVYPGFKINWEAASCVPLCSGDFRVNEEGGGLRLSC